jgi:diaminohydroxyphosphoribosylaminopyrimidine deaminase/5-amino-6-(5-phosphoribosylamino)uracil reductase
MSAPFSPEDLRWMDLALRLGGRGVGRTRGNPPVGAVIVQEGRAVGAGYHTWEGVKHAETWALERAGEAARGATCYVTMEPCGHTGRTPPCAGALARAGVARVVYGAGDPTAKTSGEGPRLLRESGVVVEEGCRREEGERLAAAFLHAARTGRSLLTAKAACGPDARLASVGGDSRWLSSETSRRLYRRLRSRFDAVAVGIGTALRDDPHLGLHDVEVEAGAPAPAAVVLDAGLRLPPASKLAERAAGGEEVVVYGLAAADPERRRALEERGVCVVDAPAGTAARGVDLVFVAEDLARRGLLSVVVEGGGRVLSELMDLRLADRLLLFRVPRLLGGAAAPQLWSGRGAPRLEAAPGMAEVDTFPLEGDEVLTARLVWRAPEPGPGVG